MAIAQNFPEISPSLNLSFALTKKLDPRITFARASTGAYYDGKTAKAEENLFLNSVWAGAVTGTPGTPPTNWLLGASGGSLTVSGESIEFFASAGERQFINQNVSVTTGQVITVSVDVDSVVGTASATIVQLEAISGTYTSTTNILVSDGTGRKVASTTCTSSGTLRIRIGASTVVSADDCTVSMKRPQFEIRSSATAYTPTTTQPITNYIPVLQTASAGVARFDHNPVTGESLGLLVEESRTNLLTYSEDYSNAVWNPVDATVVSNTVISPDGTLTGDKLVSGSGSGISPRFRRLSTLTNTAQTVTIYAKKAEWSYVAISQDGSRVVYYDLDNGSIVSANTSTGTITPVDNGWYRCAYTQTGTANGLTMNLAIQAGNTASFGTQTGDGYSGIYIWGAQLEAGAFPTSYIPTVASQVTRAADSASIVGANFSEWYRADEGTLYIDSVANLTTGTADSRYLSVSNTAGTSLIDIYRNDAAFSACLVRSLAANQADFNVTSVSAKASFKATLAFATNDISGSTNASSVVTDTSAIVPAVERLDIGSANGYQWSNATIKKIAYYPARLTNEQLQALTS